MKKLLPIAIAALILIPSGGCALLHQRDPATGQVVVDPATGKPVVDPQKLAQTSALLKTTVASSITIAIEKNPNDAPKIKEYLGIAKTVIDGLIADDNYTPGAFQDAILSIDIDSPEAKLAMITAIGLYEIYLAEYVTGPIKGDLTALTLVSAVRDGIALGIQ